MNIKIGGVSKMIDTICAKMVQDRKQYEAVLENVDLKTLEDAKKFAEALTKIIWDHQMIGLVHEFYADHVLYKTANGRTLTNAEGVVLEILAMQAAFPDMVVHITETFASGNETEGFNVYQRSYCEGTNKGPSAYGPATGRKLNEKIHLDKRYIS